MPDSVKQAEGAIISIAVLIITALMSWVAVTVHTISIDIGVMTNEVQHHSTRLDSHESRIMRLEVKD